MKQQDIAALVLVSGLVLIISWLAFNALLNKPETRSTDVEIVNPISAEFAKPDRKIFNENALNPTELIRIGESNTPVPFGQ